ncbi:MAG: hypothetical protein ACJAUP_001370 [Cellvibrionaceae bacterium]|jgi:hypothetical protein
MQAIVLTAPPQRLKIVISILSYTLKPFGPRNALMAINQRRLIVLYALLLGVAFTKPTVSKQQWLDWIDQQE